MEDMRPEDIRGVAREKSIVYHDGSRRRILATEIETPFPPGELIVSQTDLEGRITMCNEAFVRMSGYQREELIGAPHHILRHPDMPAAAFEGLWKTVRAGQRWNGYVKNLRRDGGFYWVFATVIPKRRGGEIVGFTSVRREPSRAKIEAANTAYAAMMQAESVAGESR